jgi:hypothetical protein
LQETEGYGLCNINNADETHLFFSLKPGKTLTFWGHFCHSGT